MTAINAFYMATPHLPPYSDAPWKNYKLRHLVQSHPHGIDLGSFDILLLTPGDSVGWWRAWCWSSGVHSASQLHLRMPSRLQADQKHVAALFPEGHPV